MDEKKDLQLKAVLKAIYAKTDFADLAKTFKKNVWTWNDPFTSKLFVPNEREIRNTVHNLAIDLYKRQNEEYQKEMTIGTGRLYLHFIEDEDGEMEASIEVRFHTGISVGTIIENERLTVCCPGQSLSDYNFCELIKPEEK